MATRFAVASTAWNTPSTWDNGAVPVAGDTVYPNGFTVPIDTDISVASLNNNIPNIILPNMNIQAMTTNTTPSGIADSSAPTGAFQPYYVFDQIATTAWGSSNTNTGWVSYDYGTNKLIKRYYIKAITVSGYTYPVGWNFEGWNGSSWVVLESKTGMGATINSGYASPLLTHITSYSKYRINITASANITLYTSFSDFQMTESSVTVLGGTTGGSFTVPSTLVGTRNIEFTGAGILCSSGTVLITLHNNGSIVNFNTTTGNYIINPNWFGLAATANAIIHNGTAGGIINFNGDLWGCQVAVANAGATLTVAASAGATTINIIGKIYSARGQAGNLNNTLLLASGSTTLNVTGDLIPNNVVANPCISVGANNTINITGTLNSNIGSCISSSGTCFLTIVGNIGYTNASSTTGIILGGNSTLNVTGTITAPPNANAISISGTGAITITGALTSSNIGACISSTGTGAITIPTGIVTAGTNVVGIAAPSATLVTIGNSPLINTNGYMAVAAPKIRLYSPANVQWVFQDNLASNKVLYSAGGSIGLPLTTDVRNNIQYGASNELTGTMVVPTNPNVRLGVQVDVQPNVGTADLTAQDIFTAIATSPDPVAERLRNVSTVQTTGDQLAAF